MNITLPTIAFQAGRRADWLWAFSCSRRAMMLDLGRIHLDAFFGARVIAFDPQAARRARGLVGLVAFLAAVGVFLALALPLILLAKLGELALAAVGLLGDHVFQPVLDALVPVQRPGFRDTLKALVKEVFA